MNDKGYNLSWDTYSECIKGMIQNMWKSDNFTDVTLVSDDKKQKKAHKFILSAFSDVFKSILENIPENNAVIYLKGVKYQELESVLEFIYFGETSFSDRKMNAFFEVAKSLEIKEFKEVRVKEEQMLNPTTEEDNDIEKIIHEDVAETSNTEHGDNENLPETSNTEHEDNENLTENSHTEHEETENLPETSNTEHEDNENLQLNVDQNCVSVTTIDQNGAADKENVSDQGNDVTNDSYETADGKKNEKPETFKDVLDESMEDDNSELQERSSTNADAEEKLLPTATLNTAENEIFQCNKCDYKSHVKRNFQGHMSYFHRGFRYCDLCEKKFRVQHQLTEHIRVAHEGLKFECNYCEFQGSSKKTIKIHTEAKHEGIKYKCDFCDTKLSIKSNLRLHILSVHKGVTYNCNYCDYKTLANNKRGLRNHIERKHPKHA